MTNEMATNELMHKIDFLMHQSISYYYKKLDETMNRYSTGYFSGMLDGFYSFAYYMVDEYSLQDAIDMLCEDIEEYQFKKGYYYFGYVKAAKRIIDSLDRFAETYYEDTEYEIKHIYSIIGIDNFNC